MREKYGEVVIGIDFNFEVVEKHRQTGRNVIVGDAADFDFWERAVSSTREKIRMVILAMPQHKANMNALEELTRGQFPGKIAAAAKYDDEVEELKQAGAHAAYNIYAEAGFGYAEHICQALEDAGEFSAGKTEDG